MSSEEEAETAKVFDELKKKYPSLSDDAIADIMKTGAEHGIIKVEPESASTPGTGEPEFDVIKALKGGDADLDQIMRFMIIDSWVKERFGKGRDIPPEIREVLEKAKSGKSTATDLDQLLDRMMKYEILESFLERRGARKQPQNDVDIGKAIREMGDKMTDALKTHKLEDERERAEKEAKQAREEAQKAKDELRELREKEEAARRLDESVGERVSPLQKQFNDRMAEITERLKDLEPEKRKGLVFDLGEMVEQELGSEIKERIVEGIKDAFGDKDAAPVTVDSAGKMQWDWYKLGERGLKVLERFIDKLPTGAPQKREIKEIPKLPPPKPSTAPSAGSSESSAGSSATSPPPSTPSSAPTETKTMAEPEKSIIAQKPKEEVQQQPQAETSTSESTQSSESGAQS